jgi:pimeloyl-ACP methyl ester carboxylesterase
VSVTTEPAFPLPRSVLVDVDGPVHVGDFGGPDDGPLLVAVHGLGGSHLNWLAVAPALTRRARVLAVDLVGHGRTPCAGRTPDIDGHVRLLDGTLRAVADGPAMLVGNSMGGLVAALQAASRPASVAGLALIDAALPAAGGPGIVHPRVLANFAVCAVPGLGEWFVDLRRRRAPARVHVERLLRVCCVSPRRVPPEVVDALVDLTASVDRRLTDASYLRSARSLTSMMVRPARIGRTLVGLEHPVLLVHGDRDWLVPVSVARRLAAARPAWELAVARDVGHVPMLEAPDWTAATLDRWLSERGAPAAAAASVTRIRPLATGSATAPVPRPSTVN